MKLMIFSGTTEGHDLCRFLSKNNVQAEVFVATEYGAAVMEPMAGITVHEGRLDEREMEKRLTSDTLLIDATHPYAAAVTDNLRAACAKSGARYERLLRPALPYQNCEIVLNTAAAVDWLNAHEGKVLLTTGSKELEAYTAVQDFQTRLFPRVLPTASVLEKCAALGFPGAHIIAMQGPFSAGDERGAAARDRRKNPRDQGYRRVRRLCGEGRGSRGGRRKGTGHCASAYGKRQKSGADAGIFDGIARFTERKAPAGIFSSSAQAWVRRTR